MTHDVASMQMLLHMCIANARALLSQGKVSEAKAACDKLLGRLFLHHTLLRHLQKGE